MSNIKLIRRLFSLLFFMLGGFFGVIMIIVGLDKAPLFITGSALILAITCLYIGANFWNNYI